MTEELEEYYQALQNEYDDLLEYGKDLEIPLDIVEVLF